MKKNCQDTKIQPYKIALNKTVHCHGCMTIGTTLIQKTYGLPYIVAERYTISSSLILF